MERTQRRFGKFLFCSRIKSCFYKYSIAQDSSNAGCKEQSTKRGLRRLAQPKRDSAFEQKTRIVPSRETSGSSQIIFFSYNQRKKQSRAQTDIFVTYSTSFWKVSILLKKQSCFYKYSITQDSSNAGCKEQSTKRSLRCLAQPKRDSLFE